MAESKHPEEANDASRIGVIDMIAHDPKRDEVVLVMNEPQSWNGSPEQLIALQERFNAYVSFLVDGEFAESDPNLAQKHARIEVRCVEMPDALTLDLLAKIHDQLELQEIKLEVVVKDRQSVGRDSVEPPD